MTTKPYFYVTTPIYYVNDKPHIGHAYTTILADVLARYHRLMNVPTFFLTGTDEHGQKVERAAKAAGITPQQQADTTVVRFQELWKKLGITHDDFLRTTENRHKDVVRRILQDLFDRDEIYRDEYDGWYCTPCERFFMEKDLADGQCPECHRAVEKIREANYFFRMSKYQDWLVDYIKTHPGFIQPAFRANETLGFLQKKLNDLCISRPKSRLNWGIELPFDADYVTYVWFDALINYISAMGYLVDNARFEAWWPASCQLIGKDILTTHTVYWPTMLKAMGLPLPQTVFAHGWWLSGDSKMSKSLGNVVNPMEMVDRYGVDAFRYFLSAEMVMGQDANFTEEAFARRFNADLANDLGNLLSRLCKMIGANCGGAIPAAPASVPAGAEEQEVWQMTQAAADGLTRAVADLRLDAGLGAVVTAIRGINRYLEQKQPWSLAKLADPAPLHVTLYTAAEALRVCATLLYPVMPAKMGQLRKTLGLPEQPDDFARTRQWGQLAAGTRIAPAGGLFPRLDLKAAAPTPAVGAPPAGPAEGVIAYDDFMKAQLRVACVLAAEKVAGADKLLRLEIEISGERRQIVAGIALHYTPEQLVGRTIVVVANLKPAKIRGIESHGMLLAASAAGRMRLVTVDGDMPSGAVVK